VSQKKRDVTKTPVIFLFPENTPQLVFLGCAVVSTHMTSLLLHSQQVQHRWLSPGAKSPRSRAGRKITGPSTF